MNNQELEEALQEAREQIERDVAGGFKDEEEICEQAMEMLGDEVEEIEPEQLRPQVARLTSEAVAAHLREQASWPAVTDCDRLDAAFAELEKAGIVARQDFTCCGTCGSAEIWDEMEEAGKEGRDIRGYAFYHMQDTEHAVDGAGLYLGYGAAENEATSAVEIAREIVATVERHGLLTEWDGTIAKRILVTLDWKRRRKAGIARLQDSGSPEQSDAAPRGGIIARTERPRPAAPSKPEPPKKWWQFWK